MLIEAAARNWPRNMYVARKRTIPDLRWTREHSIQLTVDYADVTMQGDTFKRTIPICLNAVVDGKRVWTGSQEELHIAQAGGGEFYELVEYGEQGCLTLEQFEAEKEEEYLADWS